MGIWTVTALVVVPFLQYDTMRSRMWDLAAWTSADVRHLAGGGAVFIALLGAVLTKGRGWKAHLGVLAAVVGYLLLVHKVLPWP